MSALEKLSADRVVVFDTETTGLNPASGDRVVEVACIELVNLVPSGRELHFYCNPERDMPPEAQAVHGLSAEFLADKPLFADQAARFLEFVEGAAALVAHNADFDIRFINSELVLCGRPPLSHAVTDTLMLARRKFPGSPATLDALCRRFGIDLSDRVKHGALIDTRLLARVYLELMGGHQPGLALRVEREERAESEQSATARLVRPPRPHAASVEELALHQAMLAGLKNPLWLDPSA